MKQSATAKSGAAPGIEPIGRQSNVFGLISLVEEIFRLGKHFDAYTVVDMAQSAGLVDCNVGSNVIDFACLPDIRRFMARPISPDL